MDKTKETLASESAEKIKELILCCKLLPGEKIKGDYLRSVLGVGLSPIREALSRLLETGVIELIDNVGYRVTLLTRELVTDFYQSYAQIERILFIESIKSYSETWESNLVAALYQLAKVESTTKVSYSTWSEYNDKFHEALIAGCKLYHLVAIYKNLTLKRQWIHNLAYGVLNDTLVAMSHREHSKIADLALKKDTITASNLLYNHTLHSCELLLNKLSVKK